MTNTAIQINILSSELYTAVVQTEQILRSPTDYDHGTIEERRLAVLCYALQKSAENSAGTAFTRFGVFAALRELSDSSERRPAR